MRLALVGDVMLGRLVNEALRTFPPAYPWGGTLPLLQRADWRFGNLECALSNRGSPWTATPKVFHFRSDGKNVAVLQAAGINAVSLANNHVLDFSYEGMFDTLRTLDGAGIAHAGAGIDLPAAMQPAVSHVAGNRIGVIAFTDNEPAWAASVNQPGVFHVPLDDLNTAAARSLLEVVRRASTHLDFLVVSAHWGQNWGYDPLPEHVHFAHAVVEAGADVVFGHSAHVFRGVEIYRGRPIFYSAGDFIDDYAVDEVERNDQSFIFTVETDERNPRRLHRLALYPTVIENFQARRAPATVGRAIAEKMAALCAELRTATHWQAEVGRLEITMAET